MVEIRPPHLARLPSTRYLQLRWVLIRPFTPRLLNSISLESIRNFTNCGTSRFPAGVHGGYDNAR